MAKLRDLTEMPPMARGSAEEQLAELRDYLIRVIEELEYVLTHIEADNVNDTLFERIYQMIPRAYTGLPLTDGTASAGTQNAWSRGDHRHGTDTSRAAAADLTAHVEDHTNPHEVTKTQVGLGNVDNVQQYSVSNPPPIPTPAQVGAIPATEKGSAGGVAELDANGTVPSSQLPSYVDDVLEYASLSAFPATGERGKIYVALDTNKTYRWSGSAYVEIPESLALGETSSTAYRGDRGKTAYDHSQTTGNPHGTTAADVGLGNVANERQYSALNPPPLPTPADIGAATAQDLSDHVGDTNNPHSVTAAQAGARPDTWMPTAADVGARADTWMPTAADVGARPDTWTPTKADIGLGNVEDERQYSASNPPPVPDAEDIPYDNTQSGLSATDLQAAVDELAQGGGGGGPSPSVSNPAMDGIAAPGVSLLYAREDHVHPSDSSKADVSSVPTQASDIGAQEEIVASGILKGDGAGGVSAAAAGTDYQAPLTFDASPTEDSTNPVTSDGIYDAIKARYTATTIYNTLTDVHSDTTITLDHSFTNYKFLMIVFNTRSPASASYRIPLVVSTNALPQGGFYPIANPDAQGYVRLNYVSGQARQLRVQSTNFSALYIASVSGLT